MMKDELKIFIENNREGFKETPPAIVWTTIENELKKSSTPLKTKKLTTMLKYGFGASVLIIGTVAILNLKKENTTTSHSNTITDTAVKSSETTVRSSGVETVNTAPKNSTPVAVNTSTDPVKKPSTSLITSVNTTTDVTKITQLTASANTKVFPTDTIDQTGMVGIGNNPKNSSTVWTDNSTGQMICCSKSIVKKMEGFGGGLLSTDETNGISDIPKKYLGKRIRYSAYIKTEDIAEWAGLWLRVGKKGGNEALVFDNMRYGKKDRGIRGTTPWTKYEIVVDVPMNASNILYGSMIAGTGEFRIHTTVIEIVDESVPVTAEFQTSYPGVQQSDRYRSYHPNDFWKWYVPGHVVMPDGTWQVKFPE